jgi:hypothetical protein
MDQIIVAKNTIGKIRLKLTVKGGFAAIRDAQGISERIVR